MKRSPIRRRVGLAAKRPERSNVLDARIEWDRSGPWCCQNIACRQEHDGRLVGHHAVYRQHLGRVNGDLWDVRNRLVLHDSCHRAHHAGGPGRLPLASLTGGNIEFAAELFGSAAAYEYLRRHYRGHDARVEALLEDLVA